MSLLQHLQWLSTALGIQSQFSAVTFKPALWPLPAPQAFLQPLSPLLTVLQAHWYSSFNASPLLHLSTFAFTVFSVSNPLPPILSLDDSLLFSFQHKWDFFSSETSSDFRIYNSFPFPKRPFPLHYHLFLPPSKITVFMYLFTWLLSFCHWNKFHDIKNLVCLVYRCIPGA